MRLSVSETVCEVTPLRERASANRVDADSTHRYDPKSVHWLLFRVVDRSCPVSGCWRSRKPRTCSQLCHDAVLTALSPLPISFGCDVHRCAAALRPSWCAPCFSKALSAPGTATPKGVVRHRLLHVGHRESPQSLHGKNHDSIVVRNIPRYSSSRRSEELDREQRAPDMILASFSASGARVFRLPQESVYCLGSLLSVSFRVFTEFCRIAAFYVAFAIFVPLRQNT